MDFVVILFLFCFQFFEPGKLVCCPRINASKLDFAQQRTTIYVNFNRKKNIFHFVFSFRKVVNMNQWKDSVSKWAKFNSISQCCVCVCKAFEIPGRRFAIYKMNIYSEERLECYVYIYMHGS